MWKNSSSSVLYVFNSGNFWAKWADMKGTPFCFIMFQMLGKAYGYVAELGTKRRKFPGARDQRMFTQEPTVKHLLKAEVTKESSPSYRDHIADLSKA